MKPKIRKIILVAFFLLFAITAPVVILFTAGYSYDWTKGKMVKTGILKLSTKPSGAAIIINERLQDKTTPTSFFRMLPGEYDVSMEKAGYMTWSKKLDVKSGETTFSKDIALFRDAVPSLSARVEWQQAAWRPDGGAAAALIDSGDLTELAVYGIKGGEPTFLARFSPARYDDYEMSWSPTGNQLLLRASGQDRNDLFLYSLPSGEVKTLSDGLVGLNRLTARWSLDGSKISAVTSAGAYAISPTDGTASPIQLSPRIQDAAIKGRDVLLLATEGDDVTLTKLGNDGLSSPERIAALPSGRYSFSSVEGRYLMAVDRGKLHGFIIDYTDGRIVLRTDAADIAWERAGGEGRAILFNDYSVYLADPASSSRELLTRLGTPISSCFWHSDGQHVIIATSSYVTGIEAEDHGNRSWYMLAKMKKLDGARLDSTGKNLLFFGYVGNQSGIFERPL